MTRIISFLILTLLLFSGCSNIMIADNSILQIDTENQKTAVINSTNLDQPGKVCTMTDQNTLLSINKLSDNLYSIDQYDPSNSSLVNITTSENRIFDVQAAKDGFFYTRNSLSDPSNVQISWSSYDKTKERTITNPEDSVDDTIYAYDGDKVIFINNGNELIFSDSTGVRKNYLLNVPIELRKIIWTNDPSIGYIIAAEQDDENFNLYQIVLSDNSQASMNQIASNVLDMDLSKDNKLVYIAQTTTRTIAYIINNIQSNKAEPLFSEDFIDKITMDEKNGIIYSVQMNTGIRSTIWYFDQSSNSKIQLTSPSRLISSLFSTRTNQLIYSVSQQTYLENNNIIQSNNYITNLIYTI